MNNARACPCCGEPIVPYQEVCLNCNVYLWEVEAIEAWNSRPEKPKEENFDLWDMPPIGGFHDD